MVLVHTWHTWMLCAQDDQQHGLPNISENTTTAAYVLLIEHHSLHAARDYVWEGARRAGANYAVASGGVTLCPFATDRRATAPRHMGCIRIAVVSSR